MIGILALAALSVSACGGSTLDPTDVARANAAVNGTGGSAGSASTGDGTGPVASGGGSTGATGDASTGSSTSAGGGTGAGTTGSGSTAGTGTNVGSGGTTGKAAPATGTQKGSCVGFKNQTGITDSVIKIANLADVSGPVPGILVAAQQATKAYAAYFNSTSNICGRKLEVEAYDTQTNTSADAVASQKACDETFAAVGSMEAFDSGGVSNINKCKLPEIHSILTNKSRASCPTCFSTEVFGGNTFQKSVPEFFTRKDRAATQKAAMLYVGVSASVDGANAQIAAEKKNGWKFVYQSSFDIAEFNYGPYVQQLKSNGARIVQLFGSSDMAIRFAQAFQAANYHPDYFVMNATSYDKKFAAAGSVVDGSIIYVDFAPIEEASSNPELQLYMKWLQQVSPGATPTYFGEYAWSAARLFSEQAAKLGGKLTRASLVQALKGVRGWTSNGLHSPQEVGAKTAPQCWRFLQIKGGVWRPYGPTKYSCLGLIRL